jgi:hypothetical protein
MDQTSHPRSPVLQRVGDSVNVIKWYEYGNP